MPIIFPTSPTVGQVFSEGGRSWVWTGTTWDAPSATNALQIPIGLLAIIPSSVVVSSGSASVAAEGTVTFSGVSSITLDNIFTSKFRHYRVLMEFAATTSSADINQQWRKNGATQTSAIYNWGYSYLAVGTWTSGSALTQTSGVFFKDVVNVSGNAISYDIWSPNDSLNRSSWSGTFKRARNIGIATATSTTEDDVDGMHLVITAGTMTGTMKIYGYN
jgi:hypothetical protein